MCFSSRQAYSGPRSIWNHVQAQRNASEVPERAVFLRGDRFRGGWGFLGLRSGRGWGLSPSCSRRGCGLLGADLASSPRASAKLVSLGGAVAVRCLTGGLKQVSHDHYVRECHELQRPSRDEGEWNQIAAVVKTFLRAVSTRFTGAAVYARTRCPHPYRGGRAKPCARPLPQPARRFRKARRGAPHGTSVSQAFSTHGSCSLNWIANTYATVSGVKIRNR
jgi:hypothetical protein